MKNTQMRLKNVFHLSLPLVIALFLQNLIGMSDAIMIGRLGEAQLAGAGIANFLFVLFMALPLGLCNGLQSVVARRKGEGDLTAAGQYLNATVLVSIVLSLGLILLAYIFISDILLLIGRDTKIEEFGSSYLVGRLPSMMFFVITVSLRCFWQGLGQNYRILPILIASLGLNILFNYLLIYGNYSFPKLGMFGAGLASTLASLAGLLIFMYLSREAIDKYSVLKGFPDAKDVIRLMKISIPESMNIFFISLGLLLMFSIVAQISIAEVAVFNILVNFILFSYIFTESIGISALTLVSQSMGQKKFTLAQRYGWDCALSGLSVVMMIGLLLNIAPHLILSFFLENKATIELGVLPIRLLGIWLAIDAFGKILSFSLIGAGATSTVLINTFFIWWILGLPFQWFLGIKLGYGLVGVMFAPLVVSILAGILFALSWHRKSWMTVKL